MSDGVRDLPDFVNSLDDVSPKLHQFYDKNEDGGYSLTSISALKNAKNREKDERQRWKTKAQELETKFSAISNEELDELLTLKQRKEQEEIERLEEKRQYEVLKRQMQENHEKTLKHEREEKKRYFEMLENTIKDNVLTTALDRRQATETAKRLLPKLMRQNARLKIEDDGGARLSFFDEESGEELQVNKTNDPFTVDDFIDLYAERYDELFIGANRSGTGAAIAARNSIRRDELPSKMSPSRKAAYIKEYGSDAYKELLIHEQNLRAQSRA
jgi:hypothetical protein